MDSFPAPARAAVRAMTDAAAAAPERAVAIQGAPGCNSHLAAGEMLPGAPVLPCPTFEDALDAVKDGRAARALIPIENSLHGRVADIHVLLPEAGLHIVGEWFLPIRYALMGLGDAPVQAVSHPQALGQCRRWLRARGLAPVPHPDTAAAAALVRELGDPAVAAVAPPGAAALYGLRILAEDLADAADNTTRFVLLADGPAVAPPPGPAMTSLLFEVGNVPAALYKALGGFATAGVNLTKLESYQRGASFAATRFFCDVEGRPDDPGFARALAELRFQCEEVRLLGTYPQARSRTGD